MAKAEWGTKRLCQSCGIKFYDFQRSPATCPKCDVEFELAPPPKPRRVRAVSSPPKAIAAAALAAAALAAKAVDDKAVDDEDDVDDAVAPLDDDPDVDEAVTDDKRACARSEEIRRHLVLLHQVTPPKDFA